MKTEPRPPATSTSGRGAALACWWSNRYTRGLPSDVGERRRIEIAGDVHEQVLTAAHDDLRSPGLAIAWRTVRGMPADVLWRRQEQRAMRHTNARPDRSPLSGAWAVATQSWFAPLALLLGAFNLLASLAILREEDGKMPGQVLGPIVITALAVSLFAGLWLRWRSAQAIEALGPDTSLERAPVSRRQLALLAVVLTAALLLLAIGASTDNIPVFFTALALTATTALVVGIRTVRRALRASGYAETAGLADALIIIGTLPALALFWMVIPPVLALLVIGGVVGTSPRLRTT